MITEPLAADFKSLLKVLKDQPEKFPCHDFGISRVQRALKINYCRAMKLRDHAITNGVFEVGARPCDTRVVPYK